MAGSVVLQCKAVGDESRYTTCDYLEMDINSLELPSQVSCRWRVYWNEHGLIRWAAITADALSIVFFQLNKMERIN